MKADAGWAPANTSSKAAGRELAIDPAQQTFALLTQLEELGPQGPAGSGGRRFNALICLSINFCITISLI